MTSEAHDRHSLLPIGWIVRLLPTAALLLAGCGADAPSSIVLITLDTTRADRLGCYGYELAATDNLDRLANQGVVFDEVRTCVPLTLPSHASIFTSMYPPEHGIRDNGVARLSEKATTLAEVLREGGFNTAAFVSAFVVDSQFGLDQGFDTYDQVSIRNLVSLGMYEERPAHETVNACLPWLQNVDSPFFLWVHFFDPHAPYVPPPKFQRRFAASPYDGEIAFVDRQVGRLLRAIEARRDADRIIVAVTADHGEGLEDHGESTHGSFVYDSCLRVPLILSGSGLPRGLRVETPVTIIDIMPTLLDLTGLETPRQARGLSLLSLIRGGPAPDRPVYFETCNGYLLQGWSPLVGVAAGGSKLIDSPAPELFDLAGDPLELENLFAEHSDLARRMSGSARVIFDQAGQSSYADPYTLTDDDRQALLQLGYAVGPGASGPIPYPSADLKHPRDGKPLLDALDTVVSLMSRSQQAGLTDSPLLDQALTLARETLEQDPDSAIMLGCAGTILVWQGKHTDAERYLRRSLALRPEDVDSRFNLGLCRLQLGDEDAALEEWKRCLVDRPSFVKAAMMLARSYRQRGDTEQEAQYWRHLLEYWEPRDALRREAKSRLRALTDRGS